MARKAERKKSIIDAAIQVFAEKGFFNSKVADVARRADVADGTIYLYFKNKDDILISIFDTKMKEILDEFIMQLEKINSAREKLIMFVKLYFKLIYENPELAEVFQVELRQSNKFLKDYRNQKFFDFLNLIGDIVHKGQKDGEFNTDYKIQNIKLALFGSLDELARQWILSDKHKYDINNIASEVSGLFLRGLTA